MNPSTPSTEIKHSGPGIAAVILSAVSFLGMVITLIVAGSLQIHTPGGISNDSGAAVMIGGAFLICIGLQLVAGILGVVGLLQEDTKNGFAIAGLVLPTLFVIAAVGLLAFGLLS